MNDTENIVLPDCPKCGHAVLKDAIPLAGVPYSCANCGERLSLQSAHLQIFKWVYDERARETWWNTTALLEYVHTGEGRSRVPLITLPKAMMEYALENNGEIADLDAAYAMRTDIMAPILVVEHPSALCYNWPLLPDGSVFRPSFPPLLIIDGWHRMFKACCLGRPLPAYIVPECVERKFRVRDIYYV